MGLFLVKKMRNSGNYIYDYPHSFIGKDFESKPLYWLLSINLCNLYYCILEVSINGSIEESITNFVEQRKFVFSIIFS